MRSDKVFDSILLESWVLTAARARSSDTGNARLVEYRLGCPAPPSYRTEGTRDRTSQQVSESPGSPLSFPAAPSSDLRKVIASQGQAAWVKKAQGAPTRMRYCLQLPSFDSGNCPMMAGRQVRIMARTDQFIEDRIDVPGSSVGGTRGDTTQGIGGAENSFGVTSGNSKCVSKTFTGCAICFQDEGNLSWCKRCGSYPLRSVS